MLWFIRRWELVDLIEVGFGWKTSLCSLFAKLWTVLYLFCRELGFFFSLFSSALWSTPMVWDRIGASIPMDVLSISLPFTCCPVPSARPIFLFGWWRCSQRNGWFSSFYSAGILSIFYILFIPNCIAAYLFTILSVYFWGTSTRNHRFHLCLIDILWAPNAALRFDTFQNQYFDSKSNRLFLSEWFFENKYVVLLLHEFANFWDWKCILNSA